MRFAPAKRCAVSESMAGLLDQVKGSAVYLPHAARKLMHAMPLVHFLTKHPVFRGWDEVSRFTQLGWYPATKCQPTGRPCERRTLRYVSVVFEQIYVLVSAMICLDNNLVRQSVTCMCCVTICNVTFNLSCMICSFACLFVFVCCFCCLSRGDSDLKLILVLLLPWRSAKIQVISATNPALTVQYADFSQNHHWLYGGGCVAVMNRSQRLLHTCGRDVGKRFTPQGR